MNYTIQDYQNVIDIARSTKVSTTGLIGHCEDKIAELSKPKPAPKWYRCIKTVPFSGRMIGTEVNDQAAFQGISVTELPFHFELIPEPVKVEPISMKDILFILEEACCMGEYSHRCAGLVKKIKADHNL